MTKRRTVQTIRQMKGQKQIVTLTAYHAPMAELLDPHADILLVGDSLGMVLYGMPSTLPVTLEMMSLHGKAVTRASKEALVVVDMPFGSYQAGKEEAFKNAVALLQSTTAHAIKLEGGEVMKETIHFLTQRGIPVMGHIGLQPQSVHSYGGYAKRGKDKPAQKQFLRDAKALEEAGAFAMVIEAVDATLAKQLTRSVSIPTIGIGAGKNCDGQVLVTEDLIGLTASPPPFAKPLVNVRDLISQAAQDFAATTRNQA